MTLEQCIDHYGNVFGAPNAGVGPDSLAVALLPYVLVIVALALIFGISLWRSNRFARRAAGRRPGRSGLLSLFAVATLTTGGLALTTPSHAQQVPAECQQYVNNGDTNAGSGAPIAAADDWLLPTPPAGGFPTGSPFTYGWVLNADGTFNGGTPSHESLSEISARIVGSNDTGSLDTSTVDLAPDVPGVQHEVYAIGIDSDTGDLLVYRYIYSPQDDLVTITALDLNQPNEFIEVVGTPEAQAAAGAFTAAFMVENPDATMDEMLKASHGWIVSYFNAHSNAVYAVQASVRQDAHASEQLSSAEGSATAFEFRVPYTVRSTDGTQSAGAEIIWRGVTVSPGDGDGEEAT